MIRSLILFASLLVSLPASADIRCWKPIKAAYRARHWLEIRPVAGRTDLFELEYGSGDDERLMTVTYSENVVPGADGSFTSADQGATILRFFRGKKNRFELRFDDRATGKKVSRIDGLRCGE